MRTRFARSRSKTGPSARRGKLAGQDCVVASLTQPRQRPQNRIGQSRFRLLEASDRLSISDLVVVQSTFQREVLEPGKVYFLNTQKLSKSSLLVLGHDPDDEGIEKDGQIRLMPDSRSFTIWDTIQNTMR